MELYRNKMANVKPKKTVPGGVGKPGNDFSKDLGLFDEEYDKELREKNNAEFQKMINNKKVKARNVNKKDFYNLDKDQDELSESKS